MTLRRFRAGLLVASLLPLIPGMAWAEQVRCTVEYGGEQRTVVARPLRDPLAAYDVAPIAIGSYFLFRIVFQTTPRRDAAIKLYTYADLDRGPLPLHQAIFAYPPAQARAAAHGFTGLQTVYEPVRDGELKYWCRWMAGEAGEAAR